jgi:hypothetical protein
MGKFSKRRRSEPSGISHIWEKSARKPYATANMALVTKQPVQEMKFIQW